MAQDCEFAAMPAALMAQAVGSPDLGADLAALKLCHTHPRWYSSRDPATAAAIEHCLW